MLRLLINGTFAGLARQRLYAVIILAGLALALAAALLIAIFVRQQYAAESFIPGHERIYRLYGTIEQPGQAVRVSPRSPAMLAGAIAAAAPGLEGTARLMLEAPMLRAGGKALLARERHFAWVDPNFFAVVPLSAASGDLATALSRPGTVVLTRSSARRLFGTDNILGKTIDIVHPAPLQPPGLTAGEPRPQSLRLEVTAVLEDLPPNTHFTTEVFAAGTTAGSALADADAANSPMASGAIVTYVRTGKGMTGADVDAAISAVLAPIKEMAKASGTKIGGAAQPIRDIQFGPVTDIPGEKPVVSRSVLASLVVIGALIILMAAISYVALTTARLAARAPEIAVRKSVGASRSQLILHFLGESLIHVVLALIGAVVIVELTLPLVNSLLGTELRFNLLREPLFALELTAFVLVLAVVAGLVPALAISAVRPSVALNGGRSGTGLAGVLRPFTVAVQFGLMVVLAIAALTLLRQTEFAMDRSFAAGKKPILMLEAECGTGIADLLREAPSVGWATCGSLGAFNLAPQGAVTIIDRSGRRFTPGMVSVDSAFFPAMGIPAVAGRTLNSGDAAAHGIVINETAARHFGFPNPQAAVGQTLGFSLDVGEAMQTEPVQIVGVVEDRPESVLAPANALIYQSWITGSGLVAIEAPGYQSEPLQRDIEAIWKGVGGEGYPELTLFSQLESERFRTIILLGRTVAICAFLTAVIAGMGLYAL